MECTRRPKRDHSNTPVRSLATTVEDLSVDLDTGDRVSRRDLKHNDPIVTARGKVIPKPSPCE